jgi:hypothetical protein
MLGTVMQFEASGLYFGMGNQNQIKERINVVAAMFPFRSLPTHTSGYLCYGVRFVSALSLSLSLFIIAVDRKTGVLCW